MSHAPEPLRDVIARHGLRASKALGQNFILDRQLLARIAAVPGEIAGDTVYEVGPGPGGLTRALLERGARVVAVERDKRFLPALAELAEEFDGKLEIVDADALRVDEEALAGRGARVVANLPYNVGTALLLRWLTDEWPPWWRSLTLMFQKEVAERIVAPAGTLVLRPSLSSRPMACRGEDRDALEPLGVRPTAENCLGGPSPYAGQVAGRSGRDSTPADHRSGIRPAAENASLELEVDPRGDCCARGSGNRPATAGGNPASRRLRGACPGARLTR